jgi:hypothetical protein
MFFTWWQASLIGSVSLGLALDASITLHHHQLFALKIFILYYSPGHTPKVITVLRNHASFVFKSLVRYSFYLDFLLG